MIANRPPEVFQTFSFNRFSAWFGLGLASLWLLTACGGNAYEASKTITYRGNLYNVTDVQVMESEILAELPSGEMKDIAGIGKDQFNDMLEANGPFKVTMKFNLDDRDLVYRSQKVERWGDYTDMRNDFERAQDRVAKLMREKKSAQLELK